MQPLAQHLRTGFAADAPDHAHHGAQARRRDRRVERHAAGARPIAVRRRLGRPRRKGVDLEHVVEGGVAHASDADGCHRREYRRTARRTRAAALRSGGLRGRLGAPRRPRQRSRAR
jgi:hypothetical protein